MPVGELIRNSNIPVSVATALIPLGLMLAKKGNGIRKSSMLLGLLLSANLVSGIFIHLPSEPVLQQLFSQLSLALQIIFSSLLLRGCTNQLVLQQIILTLISIFTASTLTFLFIMPKGDFSLLIQSGFGIVFLISVSVLYSLISHTTSSLLSLPEFWFAAGIFIFYGLIFIMMMIPQLLSVPVGDHLNGPSGIMCHFAQTFLFCRGVVVQRTS